MMSLLVLFWIFVILFAVIGAMRGWAKEILVSFSILLSIFIITVLERFIPFIRDLPIDSKFWLRFFVTCLLAFFGYQSPNLPRLINSARFAREKLQDSMLGIFLGGVNGYLIFGTIWAYMDQAKYPISLIIAPDKATEMGQLALEFVKYMPPVWLGTPAIYFAIALAFIFVIVVFV
jgi:hypothetical protein